MKRPLVDQSSLFPLLDEEERRAAAAEYLPTREGWTVRALIESADPTLRFDHVVEHAAGEGHLVRHVVACVPSARRWTLVELREEATARAMVVARELELNALVVTGDFLKGAGGDLRSASLLITNPPFSLAPAFLRESIARAPLADVALLVKQSFFASAERRTLIRDIPLDRYDFTERPSFNGDGNDNCDYCWAVAGPGRGGRWYSIGREPAAPVRCLVCAQDVRGACGVLVPGGDERCALPRAHRALAPCGRFGGASHWPMCQDCAAAEIERVRVGGYVRALEPVLPELVRAAGAPELVDVVVLEPVLPELVEAPAAGPAASLCSKCGSDRHTAAACLYDPRDHAATDTPAPFGLLRPLPESPDRIEPDPAHLATPARPADAGSYSGRLLEPQPGSVTSCDSKLIDERCPNFVRAVEPPVDVGPACDRTPPAPIGTGDASAARDPASDRTFGRARRKDFAGARPRSERAGSTRKQGTEMDSSKGVEMPKQQGDSERVEQIRVSNGVSDSGTTQPEEISTNKNPCDERVTSGPSEVAPDLSACDRSQVNGAQGEHSPSTDRAHSASAPEVKGKRPRRPRQPKAPPVSGATSAADAAESFPWDTSRGTDGAS